MTPTVYKPVRNAGLSAQNCAGCHPQHVADWKLSTHAHALQDLQFQAELAKDSSPKWLCLNCHTPLGNQRESLVRYLVRGDMLRPVNEPNTAFDAKLKQESVTCGVCHFRQDERGETRIIGVNANTSAPHPIVADAPGLRGRCLDCHNVTETVNAALVCSFQTGDELAAGYLAGKKDCVTCHMPEIKNEDSDLKRHRHTFIGGGVAKTLELLKQQRAAGYRTALEFRLHSVTAQKSSVQARVSVQNTGTGHRVPTGDPERFVELRLAAYDSSGKLVKDTRHRIGQTWQWSPVAKKTADNRILPGEKREIDFSLDLPRRANRLVITAKHIRLTAENAQYMKKDAAHAAPNYRSKIAAIDRHYPFARVIYRESYDLVSGKSNVASPEELDRLSLALRGK